MSKVISIGREFGSAGREIGYRLAKKLGIPFYVSPRKSSMPMMK